MVNFEGKYEGKTILIVEDDKISSTLFREMLKKSGAKLSFVKSAKETFDFFDNHPIPNLIFMDIRLPDINGLEIAKDLVNRYPDIVIVAQTAFANQDLEYDCFNAGMKAFITKPISKADIERVLNELEW